MFLVYLYFLPHRWIHGRTDDHKQMSDALMAKHVAGTQRTNYQHRYCMFEPAEAKTWPGSCWQACKLKPSPVNWCLSGQHNRLVANMANSPHENSIPTLSRWPRLNSVHCKMHTLLRMLFALGLHVFLPNQQTLTTFATKDLDPGVRRTIVICWAEFTQVLLGED